MSTLCENDNGVLSQRKHAVLFLLCPSLKRKRRYAFLRLRFRLGQSVNFDNRICHFALSAGSAGFGFAASTLPPSLLFIQPKAYGEIDSKTTMMTIFSI
jgi:hypothetical protein